MTQLLLKIMRHYFVAREQLLNRNYHAFTQFPRPFLSFVTVNAICRRRLRYYIHILRLWSRPQIITDLTW